MNAIIYKSQEEKKAARNRLLEMKSMLEEQMRVKLSSLDLA